MSLYDQIWSWSNLLLAYRRGSRGKRGRGIVAAFEHRLEEHLFELQEALRERTYRPGPYRSFLIHEPKRRLISAALFRDRVVHHALCQIVEPRWTSGFINDSFANRIGKGTHRALDRVQYCSRRFPYVLQCDIRQFFPSIDHEILREILSRTTPDLQVLWLVDQILEGSVGILSEEYTMRYFPGDDLWSLFRPRGLPIGNLTSQCWANCYLNGFDHFVKRQLRCPGYVRYVDDFVLFGNDKRQMMVWKNQLQDRLSQLRLTLHPGAHPRRVTEGVPFLGFVVYPERRRLKRRKGIHFQRRLSRQIAAYQQRICSQEQIQATVQGWVNHVRYGNTVGLRKKMLASVDMSFHASISGKEESSCQIQSH
jgi:retron-type reverse transcriptase